MGNFSALEHLDLGPGWEAFAHPDQYEHAALVLATATASGLLLAFHPVQWGRPVSREDVEQRKTLVFYSSVGALIAIICTVAPSMAFVIFGIGGLMRFRTNTGESKSTGHTIMGTLIGLCWGLGLQLVAALATVYFWLMIYALESVRVEKLVVAGLDPSVWPKATEAYKSLLTQLGCRILSHSKGFKKGQLIFTLRVSRAFSAEETERSFESLPQELRGTYDWAE
jgi:hypothetical protein